MYVLVPPRFETIPRDTAAMANTDVELKCTSSGIPTPAVTWFKNGDAVIPTDYFQVTEAGSLRILGLMAFDAGMYQCVATNAIGSAQTSVQLLVLTNGECRFKFVNRFGKFNVL